MVNISVTCKNANVLMWKMENEAKIISHRHLKPGQDSI